MIPLCIRNLHRKSSIFSKFRFDADIFLIIAHAGSAGTEISLLSSDAETGSEVARPAAAR
jgi:hypothetical protein